MHQLLSWQFQPNTFLHSVNTSRCPLLWGPLVVKWGMICQEGPVMTVGIFKVCIISVHTIYAGAFAGVGEELGKHIHNSIHKRLRILYHMWNKISKLSVLKRWLCCCWFVVYVLLIVCGGSVFVSVWYALLCVLSSLQSSWRGRYCWLHCFCCLTVGLSCYCICSVALPYGAVGWSAVCDCGISWSYLLIFI